MWSPSVFPLEQDVSVARKQLKIYCRYFEDHKADYIKYVVTWQSKNVLYFPVDSHSPRFSTVSQSKNSHFAK